MKWLILVFIGNQDQHILPKFSHNKKISVLPPSNFIDSSILLHMKLRENSILLQKLTLLEVENLVFEWRDLR